MIVLDTDVVSAIMRGELAVVGWLDRQPVTSVWTTTITIFEIRHGIAIMPAGRRRSSIERSFENMINGDLTGRILPFDLAAAEEAAHLMAVRHQRGRKQESADTMIAGIVLAQRAGLATRNTRHFSDLKVKVVDPWTD